MSKLWCGRIVILSAAVLAAVTWINSDAADKKYTALTNAEAQKMLDQIQVDIKENYYDSAMHGVDIDKRFAETRQKIAAAQSQDQALLDIAAATQALKDSHTHFRPPFRPYGVDYGWLMQPIGDSSCYVTAVRPDSDAATKGMKAGDQVVSINGISVVREDINYIEYSYRVFPQSGFHLVLRSPDGTDRPIVAMAKVIPGQNMIRRADFFNWAEHHRNEGHDDRSKYHEVNPQVVFWKLPRFLGLSGGCGRIFEQGQIVRHSGSRFARQSGWHRRFFGEFPRRIL